jgi:hypothetical protein
MIKIRQQIEKQKQLEKQSISPEERIENLKKLQVKLSFESRVSTKLLSALKSKGVKIILASK